MSRAWRGLTGAGVYALAVARGDIAGDGVARARAHCCAGCPAMRKYRKAGRLLAFCGPALEDRMGQPEHERTCGCLVGWSRTELTIGGIQPAGKVCVGSERCPQGRW